MSAPVVSSNDRILSARTHEATLAELERWAAASGVDLRLVPLAFCGERPEDRLIDGIAGQLVSRWGGFIINMIAAPMKQAIPAGMNAQIQVVTSPEASPRSFMNSGI